MHRSSVIALSISLVALVLGSLSLTLQLFGSNEKGVQQASLPAGKTRSILLVADENVLRISPDNDLYPHGVWYNVMTFNGTVPGPLIIASQGDTLKITLRNDGNLVHSLNFHAGFGPSEALSGIVKSGENKTWTMRVNYPGAFLYHCDGDNLNGIWEHIADGMYGGMVVRGQSDVPAKEFFVTFSEVYDSNIVPQFASNQSTLEGNDQLPGSFDMSKFIDKKPDLVLTNGMAFKYIPWIGTQARIILNSNAQVMHAKAGELTRWYIFDAGPRNSIAFNFGAGLLKEVSYNDPNANDGDNSASGAIVNRQAYDEIVEIPPGSGRIVEVTFPEPGMYFGNDHDVGSILKGAGFVVIVD